MKKNNIYLATKLFSFYDRYASTNMYDAVLKSKKYENANIYLPFRDSNMKVSNIGNVSKNIFDADINSLKNTDVFICRIDGLSFDAGIGFELGYCLAKESLLYVFVTDKTDKYDFKFKNKHISNKKYDVFIDLCGQKYQWNEILLNSIVAELEKNDITYWISDRYKTDYDFEKDISALDNCRIYLTCFDENEPDFDSCILQGYAYHKNKYIIGYESNNIIYFVEGGQTMGVNLMVEQSCNVILKSYTGIINKIMELKNEKEK